MSKEIDKDTNNQYVKALVELGFSEKESLVYISLLQLGQVGASKIITATDLHGQFVYNALESLESKNLVHHAIVRGRKKFTANSPELLVAFTAQKQKTAESLAQNLNSLLTLPNPQQFELYQGEESFHLHEFKTVKEELPNSEMLVIGGVGDAYQKTHGKHFEEYEYQRLNKDISVRYIGSEVQRKTLEDHESNRKKFNFRLLPGAFTGEVNVVIYGDRVCFYTFGQPVVIFSIRNKKIADSYRQFFETLWKLGK